MVAPASSIHSTPSTLDIIERKLCRSTCAHLFYKMTGECGAVIGLLNCAIYSPRAANSSTK